MRKLFLLLLLTINVACASQLKQDEFRKKLLLSNSGEHAVAFAAYKSLIEIGEDGYTILSDSWLHDGISEETWLNWSFELLSRFKPGEYQSRVDKYHEFFSNRLLRDKSFRSNVIKKLMTDDKYNVGIIRVWLNGYEGHRLVAYEVLKRKYHNIPKYDVTGSESVRSAQLKNIELFLNSFNKQ